jgi:hypothetical protein
MIKNSDEMLLKIRHRVTVGLSLGVVPLMALVIVCISGCDKTHYDAVFSPEKMTAWFQSNHSGLEELLTIAKTQKNIRSIQLCGNSNQKSQIKTENGIFTIKNRISFPITVERCVTISSSFDEDVGLNSLVVTIWFIADGFCLPLKVCEVTRVKYFEDPAFYKSVFNDQSKVRLTQLANAKWYLAQGDYYN